MNNYYKPLLITLYYKLMVKNYLFFLSFFFLFSSICFTLFLSHGKPNRHWHFCPSLGISTSWHGGPKYPGGGPKCPGRGPKWPVGGKECHGGGPNYPEGGPKNPGGGPCFPLQLHFTSSWVFISIFVSWLGSFGSVFYNYFKTFKSFIGILEF